MKSGSRARWLAAFAFVAAGSSFVFSDEQLLTVLYPSPAGVYHRIITTGKTLLAKDGGKVVVGAVAADSAAVLTVGGGIKADAVKATDVIVADQSVVNELVCGTGLTCTKVGNQYQIQMTVVGSTCRLSGGSCTSNTGCCRDLFCNQNGTCGTPCIPRGEPRGHPNGCTTHGQCCYGNYCNWSRHNDIIGQGLQDGTCWGCQTGTTCGRSGGPTCDGFVCFRPSATAPLAIVRIGPAPIYAASMGECRPGMPPCSAGSRCKMFPATLHTGASYLCIPTSPIGSSCWLDEHCELGQQCITTGIPYARNATNSWGMCSYF